jgi:hypothetical protein
MKTSRAKIAGRFWRCVLGKPPGTDYGSCEYNTRTITILDKLPPIERKGTAIHEALHAVYPFLTEDAILDGEYAVMDVLRAFGLTIVEDD